MNTNKLTSGFSIAPQISPEGVRTVRDQGYRPIVVARMDGEEVG